MSAEQTDRDLVEALELMQQLSPADRAVARAYLRWLVEDGRPETDPTRDAPAWQEAKRRLADEYDAAQERGEVAGPESGRPKSVPDGNALPSVADIGLTRKDIHEARS